ncbi:MAG: hypothetical protein ACREFE_03900 [Limisphaerales bacterium]
MNTDTATLTSSTTDENTPHKNGKAKPAPAAPSKPPRPAVNQERAGVFKPKAETNVTPERVTQAGAIIASLQLVEHYLEKRRLRANHTARACLVNRLRLFSPREFAAPHRRSRH